MNLKFLLNSKLFMSLLKEIAFHFDPPPINNADILFFISFLFFFCHLVKLMSEFSTELFI